MTPELARLRAEMEAAIATIKRVEAELATGSSARRQETATAMWRSSNAAMNERDAIVGYLRHKAAALRYGEATVYLYGLRLSKEAVDAVVDVCEILAADLLADKHLMPAAPQTSQDAADQGPAGNPVPAGFSSTGGKPGARTLKQRCGFAPQEGETQ